MKPAARHPLWPLFVGGSALAFVLAFAAGAAEKAVVVAPLVQRAALYAAESYLPNLDLAVPRWLDGWLMTPAVHAIHHARRTELALHNYTNVFPLWDRMLGSFLAPSGRPRRAAGLADDPNPPGFWAQVLAPLGLS